MWSDGLDPETASWVVGANIININIIRFLIIIIIIRFLIIIIMMLKTRNIR